MSGNCKKYGFTLMELMVYIAILGVIVLIAGNAFSDSTRFRIRTQNMLKANEVATAAASMFVEDISQTGAKSYKTAGDINTPDKFETSSLVYMDPDGSVPDSSSFSIVRRNNGDSLTVRRVRFDSNGEYEAVEEVSWFKRRNSIYRSCKTLDIKTGVTAPDECPTENMPEVEIVSGVDSFIVVPARPVVVGDAGVSAAVKSIVLPEVNSGASEYPFKLLPRFTGATSTGPQYFALASNPTDGGVSQELSGFKTNYIAGSHSENASGKKVGQVFVGRANTGLTAVNGDDWKTFCSKVTLDSTAEYEISFKIPYSKDNSRLFCAGRDHASVGFRTATGDKIAGLEDFLFYPPVSKLEPALRAFRFRPPNSVKNACLAFSFASYAPDGGGRITINDLFLKKIESSNYNFDDKTYDPATTDKQNVKAFQLRIVVTVGGETGEILQVAPMPSNGPED
ncbi:prepilin-type N-terminal cleavage/methylation domain-containing protein [Fibrobacter sp.]|uniref:PilW family protein n=1 Tax=Fibrobacter sp. TaxID=35828 RepID=UPI0025BCCBB3|nr:prepilin-type N-terminal cleavage/methylation domain-containing protein [Fibrobacter sp.]